MRQRFFISVLMLVIPLLSSCGGNEGRPLTVGIAETCREGSVSVGRTYIDAIVRGGHIPLVIPDNPTAASLLEKVDILLLIGGDDIEPRRYGEEPLPECGETEPERDRFESALLDEAVRLRKPVFGICRGVQMINVYFGGTLYQDIPTQYGTNLDHKCGGPRITEIVHSVAIAPESRLRAVLGVDSLGVNSSHHQAVKDLAPGFRVSATAPDGIIEGIESATLPVAGVQFHPERLDAPAFNRIFEHLLSLCGQDR